MRLQSVPPQWRPWGQLLEATHTTTPWPSLRLCLLSSKHPTWQLKARSASLRIVCAASFLPSLATLGCVCCHSNIVICVPSCRHSGAWALRSCSGFTKPGQGECDGGSGDIQRSSSTLLGACAKGQLPARGSWTAQGGKCWLHVSSCNCILPCAWLAAVSSLWRCCVAGLRRSPACGDLS